MRLDITRIARNLQLSYRAPPPLDVHQRVGVHARRGDKIGMYGNLAFFDKLYEVTMDFLQRTGNTKVHLCTDDRAFAPELSRRFRARGFDVSSTTPTASARSEAADNGGELDDLTRVALAKQLQWGRKGLHVPARGITARERAG